MLLLKVVLLFSMQAEAPRVIVGLIDGQQLVVENPQFVGFIDTRGDDAGLRYRHASFHGTLSLKSIARVDFVRYERNSPFILKITLKNGQKIDVESDGPRFVTVKGNTDVGTVTINHPDPISRELRIRTKSPDRYDDLRIAYLEFPAP
jgi:hypothetical protein